MDLAEMMSVDITEEMISDLVSFLDSNPGPEPNPKMAILYGRLKARWMILENGEKWLDLSRNKKKESYKWKILNEMKKWKEEILNENWGRWHYEYEVVNVKNWEKWRTLQLGFIDQDLQGNTKWKKSVVIEEWHNPEFFKEMIDKYVMNLANNQNQQWQKPF